MNSENIPESAIAIIGMSCRFPGSKNVDEFWQNLYNGVECISVFSEDQLREALLNSLGYLPESSLARWLNDPNYINAGAALEDIDLFDASFFGYNSAEAELLDPQQRIFLECAWEALEYAGYNPETYKGLIGVYAGAEMSWYHHNLQSGILPVEGDLLTLIGNEGDYLTTRVSYKLNLRGPSFNVQSACSTSLVATHVACQSLKSGECDMALAGGVVVYPLQKVGYLYQEGGIVSRDGHCRSFDAQAQGTVFANGGAGVVVLKRLADAVADGDTIYALIRGSATNNDGSLKAGYTAPGIAGQVKVLLEALAVADAEADSISYIEAHGTATTLGDPIEIAALTQAFRRTTQKKNFCGIGSVKSNLGHLGVAAGIAGLIKTTLALQHKKILPSLHYEQPNPQIDFANSPFYVSNKLSEWETGAMPRRAGVSSLGMGGSNAHVILEEAPLIEASKVSRPWQLLILSAKTSSALETLTANLIAHLKRYPDLPLADLAFTLQVGRKAFPHRRMLVCRSITEAVDQLEAKRVFTSFEEPKDRSVVFMFPGQGAQYVNMGLDLYQGETTFREQIDTCSELLKHQLKFDLREIIYPPVGRVEAARQQLHQTFITQPALFVIEYALARLWMKWGIRPRAMIGHSIGEYVAACLAGVLSLEDALALVAIRGRLMQELTGGAMLTVSLSEKDMQTFLGPHLTLAANNGATNCVVSGPSEAVEQLEQQLTEKAITCHRLHTSHAFHSQMMDPILERFTAEVNKIILSPPKIPYISNVTGTWITAQEVTDSSYWARHLRQSVRFADGIHTLLQEPNALLLEIGPGQVLTSLVKSHPDKSAGHVVLSSTHHAKDEQSDTVYLLTTLGRLWLTGIQIDWTAFYAREHRNRLPLPTYPFERQRYWVYPSHNGHDSHHAQKKYGKKPDVGNWFYMPSWKRSLPPVSVEGGQVKQALCWLIFSDACEVGTTLVKRLEQEGQRVITVLSGEHFTRLKEHVYILNPRQSDDYASLLKDLSIRGDRPQKIVHLWSVTPTLPSNDHVPSESEWWEASQDLGFYSLFFLAQALGKQDRVAPLHMWVVTNNMQEVAGEEVLYPEKATILGPCRVIPQEYSHVSCCSVDIVLPATENWQKQRLIDQLIDEFAAKPTDAVVAYRGDHRCVQTFEAVCSEPSLEPHSRLRERGVYLITGGLGGTGLALAEYLAREVRAKLVLIARSVFPERARWVQWMRSHGDQDEISQKIRKVQALEELGAEVLVVRADVSNQGQMREVITQTYDQFGFIHGVIHAAGIANGRIIQLKTRESAEQILAPKVKGTLVLAELFKDTQLDFLVLCSSLASVLGSFGQVDYCAANAFLDAFAHRNTSRYGTFTLSINWDIWQEVSQAANTQVVLDLKKLQGEGFEQGISLKEGMDVFRRILGGKLRQVIVSTLDFYNRVEHIRQESSRDEMEYDSSTKSLHSRPELTMAYVAARNEIERALVTIWQELFGINQVGVYDNFYELGGHSLLATRLASRVRSTFQLEVPLARILESHTIATLAELIEEMLIKKVEELPEEEVLRLTQNVLHHA